MSQIKAIFILIISSSLSFADINVSKTIFSDLPFSSQFIEDGALIRNVNYKAVRSLIPQINRKFGVNLKDRGESHITVITPPEAKGWFTPDHKGIHYLISSLELHQKYFSSLQNKKFKVLCVGRQTNDSGNDVFYLVVDSPELFLVRNEIQKELESRAGFTGKKTYFNSKNWHPHITIGFVGGDVHGVPKDIDTCVADIALTPLKNF